MTTNCVCSCGNVQFHIPNKPNEIAHCYCSICQFLHNNQFASFVRYDRKDIDLDESKLSQFKSSDRAIRYRCQSCHQWVCMIYNHSKFIWLVTDLFSFDLTEIETYDIYRSD